ncbi:MAG: ATPase [Bacteroidetes bacterium GWE2_39_28]|nr:MAG: ATPase [Bacteroidetes bacterium GWE2_39_28]OFY15174.1 MAG: ATPase [Bacteroidetes bacterium GWF2_39_10]OFZ07975.1 MAG: ATPase [Bacteroidetes bacterium RIFOXYB2_FULL_39_7]OFZ10960.1 MAG: ATPase [Bacteroidetes bacterium RIFOXYC2_FULL_39_11]HCT93797.1 ATPase [Rikenellaceae bacterium]
MRLIADSGSTKVDWRAIHSDGSVQEITTAGINPFFQTEEQIVYELQQNLLPDISASVNEIHFYGAGVSSPEKVLVLQNCFRKVFPKARSNAYTDLLAAARALCGKKPGIAAILGTGANSCFYDGNEIVDNVPACGFILGDEGSGAVLGKKFISDYLKRQLPSDLNTLFDQKYNLNYNSIIERVYRQPFPNRYLATFSVFLHQNKTNPYVSKLLKNSFEEFFTRNVMQYDYKKYPVNLVGSVAFHYEDIIKDVAKGLGVKIGNILQSPIDGLAEYHKSL